MGIRIILDLDEVLLDWCGPACKAFYAKLDDVQGYWTPGMWGIVKPLDDYLTSRGMCRPDGKPLDDEKLWAKIREVPNFWESLPRLPWATQLIKMVDRVAVSWLIVTQGQPYHDPRSYGGKVYSLQSWLGRTFDRFAITCHKYEYARSDTILIDDNQDNCKAFVEHGGQAILFPRYHNNRHEYRHNPMEVVERSLARHC